MATVMRVLFHDTKNQISLLTHLGAKPSVRLLNTHVRPPVEEGALLLFSSPMGRIQLSSDGRNRFFAPLGDVAETRLEIFQDWWTQEVWIEHPIRLTRKNIILTAADRDGGAHVDVRLTPEYEALSREGAAGTFTVQRNGAVTVTPITDAHFVCLRQMGYEVLNSPDLRALTAEPSNTGPPNP